MLCAYYDKSCDSSALFDGLEISRKKSFHEYLNKYDVLYLDITWFISRSGTKGGNVVLDLQAAVIDELRKTFRDCVSGKETYLPDALLAISQETGRQFIIIIDEWDALFREAKNDKSLQKEYVQLLRGLFKGGTTTDETIAAAYMTGILPIKKYGTESALTDFREFTMTNPGQLTEYVGFTEKEVKRLCDQYQMDFEELHIWYDGYSFHRLQHVYSPNSVMHALQNGEIQNYWTQTETFESLRSYISMDFDGLKAAITEMLGGGHIGVRISTFQNDLTSFESRNDVLTLLIHLCYLAYDSQNLETYIPNLEISEAFEAAVSGEKWETIGEAFSDSEKLLRTTLNEDADAVAESLELVHESVSSILQYHNEASLSCAVEHI